MATLLEYVKKEFAKEMKKFDPIKDNPDPIGWSEEEAELCYKNNIATKFKKQAREVLKEMDEVGRSVFFGYINYAANIEEDPDEEDYVPGE